MQNLNEGLLFDPALSAEIKDRFYYVDADPEFGQRLFFENSGGSLRLKASVEAQAKYRRSRTARSGCTIVPARSKKCSCTASTTLCTSFSAHRAARSSRR